MRSYLRHWIWIVGAAVCTSGCVPDELSYIQNSPEFTAPSIDAQHGDELAEAAGKMGGKNNHGQSLWRAGGRSFFQDNRANKEGDILRIVINQSEMSELKASFNRNRTSQINQTLSQLLNMASKGIIGGGPFVQGGANNNSTSTPENTTMRSNTFNLEFSAIVKRVLPNGNLVLLGRQEVRVDNEVRELFISGIARAVDVDVNNTVDFRKLAEARLGHGGRGVLSQYQRPAWGNQVISSLAPF